MSEPEKTERGPDDHMTLGEFEALRPGDLVIVLPRAKCEFVAHDRRAAGVLRTDKHDACVAMCDHLGAFDADAGGIWFRFTRLQTY